MKAKLNCCIGILNRMHLLILIVSFILINCGQPKLKSRATQNNGLCSYQIPETFDMERISLTDIYAENIEYIPLETNSESILSKINKFFSSGNDFFICDYGGEILRFNTHGEFLGKIGALGKGPNEFIVVSSIAVDNQNNNVFILSSPESKIYVYNFDGEYVNTIRCSETISDIYFIDNMILCYSKNRNCSVEHSFEIIDVNGEIIKYYPNIYRCSPIGMSRSFMSEISFYLFNNELHIKELFSDTVFHLKFPYFEGKYIIDRKNKRPNPTIRENFGDIEQLKGLNYMYIFDRKIFEFSNFIYYQGFYKQNDCFTIFSKKEQELRYPFQNSGIINDLDNGPEFWIQASFDKNHAISWVFAHQLKAHVASDAFKNSTPKYPEKKKELERLAKSLSENDNPVLMIVKLKE
jgi:hypothetical protein